MLKRLLLASCTLALALFGCTPTSKTPVSGVDAANSAGAGGGETSGGASGSGGTPTGATGGTGGNVGPDGSPEGTEAGGSTADASGGTGGGAAGTTTPPAGALETVQIPASGDAVTTKTSLDMGQLFLLEAVGAVDFGAQKVDAEYAFGSGTPADMVGTADVGVDIGVMQVHPKVHTTPTPPGPGRTKWGAAGGSARDDHTYYVTLTGEGKPLTIKLTKPADASAGSGSIALSILRLSPAPPTALGTELETVMVPLQMTIETSKLTTEMGKQYILQASGQGHVSKNGLGDAEYMDYDPAGTRFNEGEAGADFGIGVDETSYTPAQGATYKPRLRWWGMWRMDHTYYMVFYGTGMPIKFFYFDSGYADNQPPTDQLTVKIFAAP